MILSESFRQPKNVIDVERSHANDVIAESIAKMNNGESLTTAEFLYVLKLSFELGWTEGYDKALELSSVKN